MDIVLLDDAILTLNNAGFISSDQASPIESEDWNAIDEDSYECSLNDLDLRVQKVNIDQRTRLLCFNVHVQKNVNLLSCHAEISLPKTNDIECLSSTYELTKASESKAVNMTPLCISWKSSNGETLTMTNYEKYPAFNVKSTHDRIYIKFWFDHVHLHPRKFFTKGFERFESCHSYKQGDSIRFSIKLTNSMDQPCIVPSRYPFGHQAAFVITDHPDFDHENRLAAFNSGDQQQKGWLGRGLKLSKGAFKLANHKASGLKTISLESENYRQDILQLHREGSEICPHALQPSGELDPQEFENEFKDFYHSWTPGIWIDHGSTIPYCYTMQGNQKGNYPLLELMKANEMNALWSYVDIDADPNVSLNILAPHQTKITRTFSYALHHLLKCRLKIALHYWRTMTLEMIPIQYRHIYISLISSIKKSIRNVFKRKKSILKELLRPWRIFIQAIHHDINIKNFKLDDQVIPGSIYTEEAKPIWNKGQNDLLLFSTQEVIHPIDSYKKESLDQLIDEFGIHVGHCYLLNNSSFYNGIFEKRSSTILKKPWGEFLNHLEGNVKKLKIWNPTMKDLVNHVSNWQHVILNHTSENYLDVINTTEQTIDGYTLLSNKKLSEIKWGDPLISGKACRAWLVCVLGKITREFDHTCIMGRHQ